MGWTQLIHHEQFQDYMEQQRTSEIHRSSCVKNNPNVNTCKKIHGSWCKHMDLGVWIQEYWCSKLAVNERISRSSCKQMNWVDIYILYEISISKFKYMALAPIGIAMNKECYFKSNGSSLLEGFPIKSNSLVESTWKEFWIMVQSTAVVPANTCTGI